MGRVADLVQRSDEITELVLLESDAQIEGVVRRRGAVKLPTSRDLRPCMLHLKVVPSLGDERVGDGELDEGKEEG